MAIGDYLPLDESHAFDMEYWGLQQKKLVKAAPPLQGQVAVVTGGGGAIGLGIADRLLAAGALVVICDIEKTRGGEGPLHPYPEVRRKSRGADGL